MSPFDMQKPIRLIEAIGRPQTANPRTKHGAVAPGTAIPRKKAPGGKPMSKEAEDYTHAKKVTKKQMNI